MVALIFLVKFLEEKFEGIAEMAALSQPLTSDCIRTVTVLGHSRSSTVLSFESPNRSPY